MVFAGILTLLVLCGTFSCRRQNSKAVQKRSGGKINVTSMIFPSYDFVRAIAGDKVNLVLLLPPGADSHSFEPSPRDIIIIKESDLFIYSGGENSNWVDKILSSLELGSGDMKVVRLIDLVDAMENDDHDHAHNYDTEFFDEHVWTSPLNAKIIAASLAEILCGLDSANAAFYMQNAAAYLRQLNELDSAFRAVSEGAKRKTLIFGDRFPFRHLTEAYGLESFAAFPSCSAEAEPSAASVVFLINKIKSENIPVVFHMELSSEKTADIICEATGAKKLLLHSAHNVSKKEFDSGANYIDLQKANIVNLKEALR